MIRSSSVHMVDSYFNDRVACTVDDQKPVPVHMVDTGWKAGARLVRLAVHTVDSFFNDRVACTADDQKPVPVHMVDTGWEASARLVWLAVHTVDSFDVALTLSAVMRWTGFQEPTSLIFLRQASRFFFESVALKDAMHLNCSAGGSAA